MILSSLLTFGILFSGAEPGVRFPAEKGHTLPDDGIITSDWKLVESKAKNAVVQIFAQCARFDWRLPYRAPTFDQGAGSGFFINNKGHLLTNYHVVDGAKTIFAFIQGLGKKPLQVQIIGVCPDADIALLRLTDTAAALVREELGSIPFLELGDSDALYPAESVLALGFPLGQRYIKRTAGEYAGREFIHGKSYIHITAPINPGNSGGPLFRRDGTVAAINTAGIMDASNIGYGVPINDVKILIDDLYTHPLLRKPLLGILCNNSSEEQAKLLGNPLPAGYFINYVATNSLAEKLGLKPHDMLYQVNGYRIDEYGDVAVNWRSSDKVSFGEILIRSAADEQMNLVVYRKGQKMDLAFRLEAPYIYPMRVIYPDFEPDEIDYEMIGGMCVMQLRANHLESLRVPMLLNRRTRYELQKKHLLVVTDLLPGSVIEQLDCVYPGTLISQLNGKKVKTLADFRDALLLSAESGTIEIMTKDKVSMVVSLPKILADEDRLSKDFSFPITPVVRKLQELSRYY